VSAWFSSVEWELWSSRARLVMTDPLVLGDGRVLAEVVLEEVALAASRFRPDSELRRINDLGARGPVDVTVSPMLGRLLRVALDAAADTGGAVDPTIGAALVPNGYDRDIGLLEPTPARAGVVPVPGWRSVRLEERRLRMPAGVTLDLGATAKAAAADLLATRIHEQLGAGVLVSLGGDIATAGRAPVDGWQVLVRDGDHEPVSHVALPAGGALATSSTARRTWQRGGRTLHHIVDPATGLPAESPWRTASVAATTCAAANAASTAAIVRGVDGVRWLRSHGLAARLVSADGGVLLLGGWPAERPGAA